jgi:hypothetical protein
MKRPKEHEASNSSAEGGKKVVGINVGGSGSAMSESSKVSRIKFSIPVIPPVTTINNEAAE